MKNEMLALILAGGQGTRLSKLTQSIAKPAVQFGGRYRIIDFALSNCANSGIHNVGVVTQYQPLALNNHIGNGSSWGLDGINSGVSILQPYSASEGNRWFEGTSHAIYQNIDYIDSVNPEYVLILSGDHIYKMDYDDMLQSHKDNNASLTVAVLDVPLKEASRFGIMNTDANNRIVEFEEKPAQPKSTKASMGIYIFDWQRLRNMLVAAERARLACQTLVKMSFQITLSQVKVFMLMNLVVIGKMLVLLSHFGKRTWSIFLQKMPWIVVTVNGRFTQET